MSVGERMRPAISTDVFKLKDFKVTNIHVGGKRGNNISETVQRRDVVTIDHYQELGSDIWPIK